MVRAARPSMYIDRSSANHNIVAFMSTRRRGLRSLLSAYVSHHARSIVTLTRIHIAFTKGFPIWALDASS